MEYLKASGRVTPAGAAIGAVLNIKPLLIIEGGRLDANAKERGTKACQRRLIQVIGVIIIPFAALMFFNQHIVLGYSEKVSVENTAAAIICMIPEGLYLPR